MPIFTTVQKTISSSQLGKRLRIQVDQENQIAQIVLPQGSGPQGEFQNGDYIDFYVSQINETSVIQFVNDGVSTIDGSSILYRRGQSARAHYAGGNSWEVESSLPISSDWPIIKPAPLQLFYPEGDIDFGSAEDHNKLIKSILTVNMIVTVKADSSFDGSSAYWQIDQDSFQPIPGPMPNGGSAVFGKGATGNIIFEPAAGVIINTPETLILSKLHGKVTLIKVGTNTWDLEGNLQPA